MIIALHTGQRLNDILQLPWSAYDGESITLRQGKANRKGRSGSPIKLRCTKTLRQTLDELPRTSPLILTTSTGRAFRKRHFSAQWKRAADKAGIENLHFNDLRGTAVTLLSEAGNTVQQVAAVTGHTLRTVTGILEKYLARTHGLADVAISNFENSPRTDFANRLQTRPLGGKIKNEKTE
jgi:integrase